MSFDASKIGQTVADYYGDQPHPQIPDVKVKEYEVYARVAARLNQAPKPSTAQVGEAFHLLKNLDMAPAEFERVWDLAKPLADRLLDRSPTAHDLSALHGATPEQVHHHYMTHPHPEYPEVQAGEIARYHAAAVPIARRYGYEPNLHEVARFALAGYEADDIHNHYREGVD